jgi:hypothetical protein
MRLMGEAMKRLTRRLTAILVALGCLGLIAWFVWPKSTPGPPWMVEYDVTARPPDSLAPGTVVGRTAPARWSHLIIKSLPRVRPGEESKLPLIGRSRMIRMASWMFTAFVADVRPESHGSKRLYGIRAIALGLGTVIGDRDVIITPETAAQHGIELDWITRGILSEGYKTQGRSTVVIHGPTLAVVDTPVAYRADGRNRLLRFRYALLVDASTGRLDTLVWLLDAQGGCGDGWAVVLAPDTIDEAELIPDPDEFSALGIPSEAAFAVDRLPRGRARTLLSPDLRSLVAQGKFTPAEAGSLEQRLRQILVQYP